MTKTAKSRASSRPSAARIETTSDWREELFAQLRAIIHEADLAIVEERKWKKPSNPQGVPVFSMQGIVCTGETYKNAVKLTFAKGALLEDPAHLFNASLEGNLRRAIDFREGARVNERALTALIREAVELNRSDS